MHTQNNTLRWQLKQGYVVLLLTLILFYPLPAHARDAPPPALALEETRNAARQRLQTQATRGYIPAWTDAQLVDSITLYNLSGEISAYLFPVVGAKGENAGYLTVIALDVPNPVLEFSATAPPPPLARQAQAKEVARAEKQILCTDRPIYVGPLSYGYELASPGGCNNVQEAAQRRLVDLFDGRIIAVDAEQAQVPWVEQLTFSSTSDPESITTPAAYKLIGGVPDYCQFWGSYNCWSGCAPTASANILGYWDGQGYSRFQSGSDWQGLVNTLRNYMDTECDGSSGSTSIGNISSGIVNYARDKGYYFESSIIWPGAEYSTLRDEIDANHPIPIDLIVAEEYWDANHTVTGVGYQTDGTYMIVHDALACGNNQGNHYIHYGNSWYESIGMHPTGPDSTDPTQAYNVRPDGWSGPYTTDRTPRFQWDAAYDNSSGIAGYYVSAKDWTPDSNDWWTENTSYTIPDALSDGEYHFAVTSKDNAGNVNPSNTNNKGDAPYYTFIVDTTAPDNPTTVASGCSAQDEVWQRGCTNPDFTWSGADDHGGSGVQDYHIYWSTDPNGTPTVWRSNASYDPGQIDTSDRVVTYYLRIATRDNLGHESDPETVFKLRYDAAAPTANPILKGGVETVHSVNVQLEPHAQDEGSGVDSIQLSNDGTSWQAQDYASTIAWRLPAQNLTWHTILLELEDKAGNQSRRYECKVCLDLYPPHPSSSNYRLWSAGPTAAGGRLTSTGYQLDHTVGQSSSGALLTSSSYRLRSGFQGMWPARPGEEMFTSVGCEVSVSVYLPLVMRNSW